MSGTTPPKIHPSRQWSPDARALAIVGNIWTLQIVHGLSSGPRRARELERVLPGVSAEQLCSHLRRMVALGLLTRREAPHVEYGLTARSKALLPVLAELIRWGERWDWPAREGCAG